MVGVGPAVNTNYHSPLVGKKRSNLNVCTLFIKLYSHICALTTGMVDIVFVFGWELPLILQSNTVECLLKHSSCQASEK